MPGFTPLRSYSAPDDLCVVACYYNPLGFASKRANARLVETQLRCSGLPLVLVEAAWEDAPFELETADLRVRCRDLLWHKEHLLNLALGRVPPAYSKVAWLDADVLFENPEWALQTSRMLDRHPLVQPFSRVVSLPRHALTRPRHALGQASFAAILAGLSPEAQADRLGPGRFEEHGHTGYAWAAQREWLEQHRLYDACVVGGGDHVMAHAFARDFTSPCLDRVLGKGTPFHAHYLAWAEPVAASLAGTMMGQVPGELLHLWHGEVPARRYLERYAITADGAFDPRKDLRRGPEGCWEWEDGGEFRERVIRYFHGRAEDTAGPVSRGASASAASSQPDQAAPPPSMDLAVITCYYNPRGYRTRRANFEHFLAGIRRSGVPLVVVEAAFGEEPFELTPFLAEAEGPTPELLQLRGGDLLWQKERLLNVALEGLHPRFTKVLWSDGDVLFEREDWARELSRALEGQALLQPFSEVVRLPPGVRSFDGRGESWESFGAVYQRDPSRRLSQYERHGHTGFAWAARRELLTHGLYDVCLSGSGDHLMAHAATGDLGSACLRRLFLGNVPYEDHFRLWAAGFEAQVQGRVGALPGRLLHLWHGETGQKRYSDRNRELTQLGFDPARDLRLGRTGLWNWGRKRPELASWADAYFALREEDGADVQAG